MYRVYDVLFLRVSFVLKGGIRCMFGSRDVLRCLFFFSELECRWCLIICFEGLECLHRLFLWRVCVCVCVCCLFVLLCWCCFCFLKRCNGLGWNEIDCNELVWIGVGTW